jgi:hypothetical protein
MKKLNCAILQAGILLVVLSILLLCVFWLPATAEYFAKDAPEYAYLKWPLLMGIYVTVIPFLLGSFEGLRLLSLIQREEAFDAKTVLSLRRIKGYAFTVAGLYIVGGFILMNLVDMNPGISLMGILIILASFMISLFAGVLEELIASALRIKTENELTV